MVVLTPKVVDKSNLQKYTKIRTKSNPKREQLSKAKGALAEHTKLQIWTTTKSASNLSLTQQHRAILSPENHHVLSQLKSAGVWTTTPKTLNLWEPKDTQTHKHQLKPKVKPKPRTYEPEEERTREGRGGGRATLACMRPAKGEENLNPKGTFLSRNHSLHFLYIDVR